MHRVRIASVALAMSLASSLFIAPAFSRAQSAPNTTNAAQQAQIAQLNQQIATYQAELKQTGANKATLQAAINALDLQKKTLQTQVKLTQTQISVAQTQITELGKGISADQKEIQSGQIGLGKDIRIEAENDQHPLAVQLLSAGGLTEVWNDVQDIVRIDSAIESHIQSLQNQKVNLMSSQNQTKAAQTALLQQKSTLTTQQTQLVATTQQKQQLLAQTNAQESKYQQLLAQAQAELNSFSSFSENAGGSSVLGSQTSCDSWGCYYNQRDSLWGNNPLDGTKYTMKSDGCLVTSVAMVMTHYGARGVTPQTINSDPSNFASYEPASLLLTVNAGGMTATRKAATIDATLATGNPVIIGLHALGGTHFIVIVSGSGGNYIVKDPYFADGNNASFSEHYTMREIYSINKVIVS